MTEAVEEINANSPANAEVLRKYQAAAEVANKALTFALSLVKSGASVLEICLRTDEELTNLAAKVYNKEQIPKGIAFPCCVSINNVLGYFSPVDAGDDMIIREGDLVKVELGAHVDEFPALVGTSLVVGANRDKPVSGVSANLVHAAHLAGEATLRMMRAGKTSTEVVAMLKQLTCELDVRFIEGMISHSITKNRLADEKMIVVNPAEGQAKIIQECTFFDHDVFVVDISLSSGNGSIKSSEKYRTTIYKRTEENYSLRLKTSRAVVSEIQNRFGQMAFNLRQLGGISRTRMALNEATQHGVTSAYEVLEDKKEAVTARVMFTVVLTPTGPLKLTDYQFDSEAIKPTCEIKSQSLVDLLKSQVSLKKDKKVANN